MGYVYRRIFQREWGPSYLHVSHATMYTLYIWIYIHIYMHSAYLSRAISNLARESRSFVRACSRETLFEDAACAQTYFQTLARCFHGFARVSGERIARVHDESDDEIRTSLRIPEDRGLWQAETRRALLWHPLRWTACRRTQVQGESVPPSSLVEPWRDSLLRLEFYWTFSRNNTKILEFWEF